MNVVPVAVRMRCSVDAAFVHSFAHAWAPWAQWLHQALSSPGLEHLTYLLTDTANSLSRGARRFFMSGFYMGGYFHRQ